MKMLTVLLSILICAHHLVQATSLPDYLTVTLRNAKSNKYLEVSGDPLRNEKYKDSVALQQWELSISRGDTDRWQKWHLIYQITVNGTRYYHIRNLHSGKLADANGTIVQQLAALPQTSDRQLWRLEDKGNGRYMIFNKGSGLALSLEGGATGNGVKVILDRLNTDGRQSWMLSVIANDTYRDDEVVRFFNRNNTTQGSAAFDQGNSISLIWGANKGKVLWVTQDAWDGVQLQSNNMFRCGDFHRYSNSVLIQPARADWNPEHTPNMTINSSTSGKPRQVFNIQPGTSWSWAGPGIEINDKVYVHCGEGQGLDITGQSLYQLTQSTGTEWKVERNMPNGLDSQKIITYSCGMVKPGDGYVYVFGKEGISFNYASYVHVARFPEGNPLLWEYYNGSGWTGRPNPGSTAKIADGRGTVSVAYLNGKYILMTMDQGFDCDTARNIYIATASSPTGPFSGETLVYTIKEYFKGQYARYYTPVIHPEFDNGRNELLLTYCLNFSACKLESCEGVWLDPYYYRVKGIRVPYAKIGL